MPKNILQVKCFNSSLEVIAAYRYLVSTKREYVLSKQLLRSGTSIGANVEEAIGGFSKKDFYAKLSIAYKEGRETRYWVKLLYKSRYIPKEKYNSLFDSIEQINKILYRSIQTKKN